MSRAISPPAMTRAVAVVALAAWVTTGCAYRWHTAPGPGVAHWAASIDPSPPSDPIPSIDPSVAAQVRLIPGLPQRVCEVVGLLQVDARPGMGEQALAELRARAAALGADAVVHVQLHGEDSIGSHSISGDPEWEAMLDGGEAPTADVMQLTGEAVRYRDAIGGRDYRVIAHIGVSDRLGREAEAFQRLAARARAIRADLVIEVQITRGADTRPFELHGTAIRFLR
jgi:uncharacterized protein YbjQ (UPF0145 family)